MMNLQTDEEILFTAEDIIDYYRTNPHYFAKDYLHIDTKDFQDILLSMMEQSQTSVVCASRGIGKTFIVSIFAVNRAVLYPGSKIVIASYRRGQAINVLKKITNELMPNSPELTSEIKSTQINGTNAEITFHNSSTISVVTAGESGRSNRATLLIVDEYALVKKAVVDDILKKFLTQQRMPTYCELSPKEKIRVYNSELNKTVYLSSATFKDSWGFVKFKDAFDNMLSGAKQFSCALPYELSIYEGLLNPKTIEDEINESDFSQLRFDMEYECLWYGGGDGAFFQYDTVAKNRNIKYPMLPDRVASKIGRASLVRIPQKKNGEIRILSADIALMSSKKHNNDATSIFINEMILTKASRYMSNIVYTESCEGMRTEEQALLIRKLFDEYQCDYLVLDCQGVGLGCFDALSRDIVDTETGEVYPALSCCNDSEMAARCTTSGAEKVIWSIKASAQFNSNCAILLREAFRSGRIRLLASEYEAEDFLGDLKGYNSLSPTEKIKLQLPYIQTTLLIDELIKLQHEETGGKIKLREKAGMRKDRYSSLSYNYYVAIQIENKMNKRFSTSSSSVSDDFIIKPPRYNKYSKIIGKAVNNIYDRNHNKGW